MPKKKLKDDVGEVSSLSSSCSALLLKRGTVGEVSPLLDLSSSIRHLSASLVENLFPLDHAADPVMALVDNAFYLNGGDGSTTGYWAVTKRPQNTAVAAGVLRRQFTAPSIGSERVFICVAAGTTANTTDATWTTTRGAKVTDGTATWQECTGVAAFNGDLTNTPNWTTVKNTAIVLGQVIQRNNGASYQICTTAGTAGNGSEPSFSDTAGTTTADNTATWTSCGAVGNFSIWNCPHARIANAFATNWTQAGNAVYVSDAHNVTTTGSINSTAASSLALGTSLICVKNAPATTPPGSADISTGATEQPSAIGATYSMNTTTGGRFYAYGFEFKNNNSGAVITFGANNGSVTRLENCKITLANNSATAKIQFGNNTTNAFTPTLELINTPLSFANASQQVQVWEGSLIWRATASGVQGTSPTTLIIPQSEQLDFLAEGVDLNGATGTLVGNANSAGGYYLFKDCKINSGATVASTPLITNQVIDVVRGDSGTATTRTERHTVSGDLTTSTTIRRTGGASDGISAYSWKLATSANVFWTMPFEAPVLIKQNRVTGSSISVTWYGVFNGASLPNNDEIWIDMEYLGDSGDLIGQFTKGTKADILHSGAALTADTSAWDGNATARQNTHAYSVGDVIAVATNPGRIFFCTAASGNSSGSEPGGYATAVDGGSVTDGSCTFRAGMRFSQTLSFTPQLAGPVYGYVRSGKASVTYYFDPKMTFSN